MQTRALSEQPPPWPLDHVVWLFPAPAQHPQQARVTLESTLLKPSGPWAGSAQVLGVPACAGSPIPQQGRGSPTGAERPPEGQEDATGSQPFPSTQAGETAVRSVGATAQAPATGASWWST